ncbi:MAG: universal stress protein, partial [Acidimicrobiia bacterium]|nr:universal stress protein [Acidimicrobiia bacterium]
EKFHIDSVSTAEQYLDALVLEHPASPVTRTISFDDPAEALCAEAERLEARMIVVGNRRVKGAGRVLGSVASDVARHAPCDVLIANTTDG